ncbi:protein phosphatase 1 regulatory subunit 37-like, partial [Pezoporus occidentalis]|uniref:protein phosphatase 1 regulatory subunit 37-like n=1 Tax=Pezoporus occidentalis TaxID=407982 RepID=UPI002F90AA87
MATARGGGARGEAAPGIGTYSPRDVRHRRFNTADSPRQIQHRRFNTADSPPQIRHRRFATGRSTPQIQHRRFATADSPRQIQHRRFNTADSPRQIQHRRFNTADSPPQIQHRRFATADSTPQIQHRRFNPTDSPPQIRRRRFNTADSPPQIRHRRFATADSTPQIQHRRFNTADSPPQIRHRRFATADSPPQIRHPRSRVESAGAAGAGRWARSGSAMEQAPGQAPEPRGAQAEDGRLRAGAKRVTFPSDEDIVSGAVEPKDPWRHAQNVTVEEILSAYKQACQKLNCKQIPKLLKQIQEFKELAPRIDCLDLKGEKLDYKACEALEEIFKRVQFKIVDLEQTSLDEDGASALFDMIEYYESATHLNISFNKHIGTRGWQAAAHMMRKTNCLQYLDARNTPLLDHAAPFVARALRISSSLVVLHLENASLSGRPLLLL